MATLSEKLRLLVEWSPLIGLASEISGATTPLERALKTSAVLRWLADKTQSTEVDDELVELLEAVLKSPEGTALFNYLTALVTSMASQEVD